MDKPVLVIMAAGMGSRYGGLKQMDPMDAEGHIIMDFSVYDAARAGFQDVIFIIKRENEEDFRRVIGDRLSGHVNVSYAFQELQTLEDIRAGRTGDEDKPRYGFPGLIFSKKYDPENRKE